VSPRHIALVLSYLGTAYHGWQIQKNGITVSETVGDVLSRITDEKIKLTGCGRTDAGVHALRYVADFRTTSGISTEKLPAALNSLLPRDISVLAAFEIPGSFHSTRSCVRKEYIYKIHLGKTRSPFLRDLALHYPYPFNFAEVKKACANFVGTHDFSAMRTLGTPVKSTVRTMYSCDAEISGDMAYIYMCANGFLYNMARAITGTLLEVARNKTSADGIPEILLSRDRARAGATAPAHGLYLARLWYNTDNEMFNRLCNYEFIEGSM
jgi:tRNA pseudouridine38-40 synthase